MTEIIITLEKVHANSGSAITCDYRILGKMLSAPAGAVGIKNYNDLDIISDYEARNRLNIDKIDVVYWPSHLSRFIRQGAGSRTRIMNFIRNRVSFAIPETEWLCYRNRDLNAKITRHVGRFGLPNTYQWAYATNDYLANVTGRLNIALFYRQFDTWMNNRDPNFIRYVFRELQEQEFAYTSAMFIPTPVIFDQVGLDLNLDSWNSLKNIFFGPNLTIASKIKRKCPLGLCLPIADDFLSQTRGKFDDCLDFLDNRLPNLAPEIILVRPLDASKYVSGMIAKFREFMDIIVNYGRDNGKPVGIIDSDKYYDLAMLTGTNIGGFRFDGKDRSPQGGGGAGGQHIERWQVNSPDQHQFIQYQDMVANGVNFPYLPQTTNIMQNQQLNPPIRVNIMKLRYLSVAEGISNTVHEIYDAIMNGTVRTYETRVLQTAIGQAAHEFLNI